MILGRATVGLALATPVGAGITEVTLSTKSRNAKRVGRLKAARKRVEQIFL